MSRSIKSVYLFMSLITEAALKSRLNSNKKFGKFSISLLVLLAVCIFGQSSQAQTNIYIFDPNRSTVVQTGGFAGVHETYPVEGRFRLSVDFDAGIASFEMVNANLLEPSGFLYTQNLGELFNMSELTGTVVDDTTIEFLGKITDDIFTDIRLTLTFIDGSVRLVGEAVPACFDCFYYDLDAVAQGKYGGGTGEPNNPYQIATAEDLILLGETPEDYDKHFILTADIDLDPNLPGRRVFDGIVIGFGGTPFTGVFDGRDHTISHLTIEGKNNLGLFGQLKSGAEIRDLGIVDVSINGIGSWGSNISSLVCVNRGLIYSCYSTGTVSGDNNVGGLVGGNSGRIYNSYSTSTVSGGQNVGGLACINWENGIISTSYNIGEVDGYNFVGGIVGENGGFVTNSYSTGRVSGVNDYVGGLVGFQTYLGCISSSYSTGPVSGDEDVGGLVGNQAPSALVSNSYSISTVSGDDYVGGLVGVNNGFVSNSYSTGIVSGYRWVGGLVGDNWGEVTNSFWDIQTSGQSSSDGGMGKTTVEMLTESTFTNAGWDFVGETENGTEDIWWILEGQDYPRLLWEPHKYGGGTGEPNDPYLIYTAEQLNAIAAEPNDWDKHFQLMANIDLSGFSYDASLIAPDVDPCDSGFQGTPFTGDFDGNNHTISYLTIHGGDYLGLFGQLEAEAEVKDLGVVDVNIIGYDYLGGLVGFNRGSVATSYSTGTVIGDKRVGGLMGRNWGNITTSYSTGTVTGNDDVGGLAAGNYGNITMSYNAGAIAGNWDVGGLVGENYGSITTSYSTGAVSGEIRVGGLVGYNWGDSSIASSFWDVETSGQTTSDGGTGKNTAEMQTGITFTNAGWDFVGETVNGTEDIWWILEGQDYPRLWWELVEDNLIE